MKKIDKKTGFLLGRYKGGIIATKGAIKFIRTEPSAQIQLLLFGIVTIGGFFFKISATEWILQNLVWGMILSVEALNTAVEKLCDFVHIDYHSKIGNIKDIAAGAVWFSAMAALVAELLIYIPKFS